LSIPASQWRLRRPACFEVIDPSADEFVADNFTSVHRGQAFPGKAISFFFSIDPSGQGLFHDPATWAIKPFGEGVDLLRHFQRYMSRDYAGRHGESNQI